MLRAVVQAAAWAVLVGAQVEAAPISSHVIETTQTDEGARFFSVPEPPEGYWYVGIRTEGGIDYYEYHNAVGDVHLIRVN